MEKNIAAFVRDDAKTVAVRFFKEIDWARLKREQGGNLAFEAVLDDPTFLTNEFSNKTYTYVTDLDLERGNWVVVMAMGQLKVAIVEEVHEGVAIEPNAGTKYKWVVSKIDTSNFEANEVKNSEIEETIHSAYKQTVKKQFQTMILSGLDAPAKKKLKSLLGVK